MSCCGYGIPLPPTAGKMDIFSLSVSLPTVLSPYPPSFSEIKALAASPLNPSPSGSCPQILPWPITLSLTLLSHTESLFVFNMPLQMLFPLLPHCTSGLPTTSPATHLPHLGSDGSCPLPNPSSKVTAFYIIFLTLISCRHSVPMPGTRWHRTSHPHCWLN